MTAPTLMSRVNDHAFRSAFLKYYAVANNAAAMASRDGVPFKDVNNNNYINMAYVSDVNLFKNYFKIERGPYILSNGGCYRAVNTIYNNTKTPRIIKRLNNEYENFLNDSCATFMTTDGVIYIFSSLYANDKLLIDVNGIKGPNQIGKDVWVVQNIGDRFDPRVKWLNAYISDDCYISNSAAGYNGAGYTCAEKIIKDKSFKIPKR